MTDEAPKERKRLLLEEWLQIENNYLKIACNRLRQALIVQDEVSPALAEEQQLIAAFEEYRQGLSAKYGMEITPRSIDKERYLIEEPVAEKTEGT